MAFRDFEREMCGRTARKVELSHLSVGILHHPQYIEPAFHIKHKGQTLEHILALRAAGVSAAAASVSDYHLESLAFAFAAAPADADEDERERRQRKRESDRLARAREREESLERERLRGITDKLEKRSEN